ncbi:hypothetical protein G6F47_000533 [Rhizopus delemar]|uniref:Peroxisomal membrane protein PEX16 n=2 Tax=Rhizopus TaxID=4842 RepID=A0A9P7CRL3_9FUNG|nr:hypothetical protein G6F52_000955 [Rhizopus delemar]KAG1547844.1 hypothetical protein G6F51_004025 [Rhizopus arrhizus]KAG1572556.1 hypothetical protein G6F50_003637 [Rhizopus delemar]KAG1589048.1 hypothetical protein G6F48_004874 [Rhizopus delemar]KAG1604873.1 hypothetical protein G6F47_000533 [Rhizopus delemar]
MLLSRRIRKGRMDRWKWITGIEGTKFILRLLLFYDPITLDLQSTEDKLELSHLDPRTGIAMSSRKELSLQSGNSRKGWAHVGEILWKIRPLVYVSMVFLQQREIHFEKDNCSEKEEESVTWKPWLVSLCIDLISMVASRMQPQSSLESDELKRRHYLLLYYLLRGPMYTKVTRLLLDNLCDATEHKPIISIITGEEKL